MYLTTHLYYQVAQLGEPCWEEVPLTPGLNSEVLQGEAGYTQAKKASERV